MSTPSHQSKARDIYRMKPSDQHGGPTPRHDPALRPTLRSPDDYASLIVQACANRQPLLGLLALYRESIERGPTARHDPALRPTLRDAAQSALNLLQRGATWEARDVLYAGLKAQPDAPAERYSALCDWTDGWDTAIRCGLYAGHPVGPADDGHYRVAASVVASQPALTLDVERLQQAMQQTRLGAAWEAFKRGRVSAWPEFVADRYARLASEGEPCAAHVHGHAPCSLPTGHDGDHAAWVTDQ